MFSMGIRNGSAQIHMQPKHTHTDLKEKNYTFNFFHSLLSRTYKSEVHHLKNGIKSYYYYILGSSTVM